MHCPRLRVTVLSSVTRVLLAATLLVATAPCAHAQPAAPQPPPAGLPLAGNDDSSKDEPNLAERLLVSPREPRCDDNGQVGGIQVCGKKKDNSKDRLPITGELNSATATADGLARAPDVMGNRITGHSIGFGATPRALLPDINFRLLPLPPVGSDADRIAKGEIRGD